MKKVFILFMSHKSGEHGLTIHNTIEEVQSEVKSVVDLIKESDGDSQEAEDDGDSQEAEESYQNNMATVEEITGDGDFHELSDSTWFDVFEREV